MCFIKKYLRGNLFKMSSGTKPDEGKEKDLTHFNDLIANYLHDTFFEIEFKIEESKKDQNNLSNIEEKAYEEGRGIGLLEVNELLKQNAITLEVKKEEKDTEIKEKRLLISCLHNIFLEIQSRSKKSQKKQEKLNHQVEKMFQEGYRMGLFTIDSLLKQNAITFGIEKKELGLDKLEDIGLL